MGSRFKMTKEEINIYTIKFEQYGFNPESFSNIKINGEIINMTDISKEDDNGIS